jgi:hypothetical protein
MRNPGSKSNEMTRSAREVASAMRRIQVWSSELRHNSANTPRSGRKVITDSKCPCGGMLASPLPYSEQ